MKNPSTNNFTDSDALKGQIIAKSDFISIFEINGTQPNIKIPTKNGKLYISTDSRDFVDYQNGQQRVLPIRRGHIEYLKDFEDLLLENLPVTKKLVVADIGCGSGIYGLYFFDLLKESKINLTFLDPNPRAIKYTQTNILLNSLDPEDFSFIQDIYKPESFEPESLDLITVNPPYHPRPPALANQITAHGDGHDEIGFKLFQDWIKLAQLHLAPDGLIKIDMMSPGLLEKPMSLDLLEKSGFEILGISEFYPAIPFETFLTLIYQPGIDFLKQQSAQNARILEKEITDWVQHISKQYKNQFWHFNVILAKKMSAHQKFYNFKPNTPLDNPIEIERVFKQRLAIHRQIIIEAILKSL